MNFLAHALLSPPEPAIVAGNVCADLIARGAGRALPAGVAAGVRLHRAIDRGADRHPAFRASRALIAAPRRRYAPVILDVAFDHCLARAWERHSAEPLERFAARIYASIERWRGAIPWREPGRIERMLGGRWLEGYRSEAGIARVFAALAHRARFGVALAGAGDDVSAHYPLLARRFEVLFADLCRELGAAPGRPGAAG